VKRRVAVIGAGWSGLACALELVRHGHPVALFDAAGHAGGRARKLTLALGDRDFDLDNGQHLLLGAYRDTLRLMREVGVDPDADLLRLPFQLRYPDGFELRAPRLPAPWHLAAALVGARKLDWASRWHTLACVRRWRRGGWTVAEDTSASALFVDAPPAARRRLWRPLCVAALNVEPEQAAAQLLLNVLRDSLVTDARSSDLLIPRRDLSAMFAQPALGVLEARGAELFLRWPVQKLVQVASGWRIEGRAGSKKVDAVVLALPPDRAAPLLASAGAGCLQPAIASLRAIETAPIVTAYLRYAPSTRLRWPAYALLDDPACGRPGQWVFDRGQLDASHAGVLSVVVSAATAALSQGIDRLAEAVAKQLTADLGLPTPSAARIVAEKRATIVASPALRRPEARLPLPGLYLAGDAAASEYPSTLEGSVRAGLHSARALLEDDQRGA